VFVVLLILSCKVSVTSDALTFLLNTETVLPTHDCLMFTSLLGMLHLL